ncbi:MAG TPA: zinc ribbon domain-containing protein [Pirellulales bacterium]|nr:zinc ribbon domain-containing protein [Pirellulales bacterium]
MDRDEDFEDDDFDDDWEAPEPDDRDDDELELLPCPACGKLIYEEAEACPYCGEYVTHSTSALAGKPIWYLALAIIGVVAVIGMIFYWVRFIPALG